MYRKRVGYIKIRNICEVVILFYSIFYLSFIISIFNTDLLKITFLPALLYRYTILCVYPI